MTRGRWALPVGVRIDRDALAAGAAAALVYAAAAHVIYVYREERYRVGRTAAASTRTTLGVDYDQFATPSRDAIQRARRTVRDHVDPSTQLAVYTGGLEPIYHVEAMLQAAATLDDWSLLVLGAGSLADRVQDAADDTPCIHYPGTVPHDHVPGYLHEADAALSLVDDPHTVKTLEYLAAGLPVVHLHGRAEYHYGDLLEWTTADPIDVAAALRRTTAGAGDRADERRAVAREHRWRDVAADYDRVLRAAVSETTPDADPQDASRRSPRRATTPTVTRTRTPEDSRSRDLS